MKFSSAATLVPVGHWGVMWSSLRTLCKPATLSPSGVLHGCRSRRGWKRTNCHRVRALRHWEPYPRSFKLFKSTVYCSGLQGRTRSMLFYMIAVDSSPWQDTVTELCDLRSWQSRSCDAVIFPVCCGKENHICLIGYLKCRRLVGKSPACTRKPRRAFKRHSGL